MSEYGQSLWQGIKDVSPALAGVLPFGLITGVVMMAAGLPEGHSVAMTLIVMAGAAQLAALDLMTAKAPMLVILFTGLVINLRFVMYSASLAPHLAKTPFSRKIWLSYMLSDQAFAMSVIKYRTAGEQLNREAYYCGAALSLWLIWQLAVVAGIFLGSQIPPDWSLDFAVPLTFLAIVFPAITDRSDAAAAVVSAAVSLLAQGLPYNLGLIVAAICGIATGCLVARRG